MRKGLAERLVGELVNDIVSGAFPPGAMLPSEAELAERAGVSRLTVREAVKSLQAQRVLEIRRGRGTFVNPVDRWSPLDPSLLIAKSEHAMGIGALPEKLVEARRLVEVGAAELAAARRSDADLLVMAGTLDRMKEVGDDVDAFAQADIDFHQAIMVAAGNTFISSLFNPLREIIWAARRQTKRRPEARAHALVAHRRIFEAVRDRDPEGARSAMHDHLVQTREDLRAYSEFFEEEAVARAAVEAQPLFGRLGGEGR